VLELGYARLSTLGFAEIVHPHLAELTAKVRESSSIAVLDGDDIRYVARNAAGWVMSVSIAVCTRLPGYATAMGRVLLADRPETERAARFARVTAQPLTPAPASAQTRWPRP
jgi:IclR family transcriptional regulator, pca regulon regulatory protein